MFSCQGIVSSPIAAKSGWKTCDANSGSTLKSSALRLSCLGAFRFLKDLMAAIISCFSVDAVLTYRSVSGSCTSASVGGGLLRTSVKCSTDLLLLW